MEQQQLPQQPSQQPPEVAGSTQGHAHHPWDEVSLPGAGGLADEQPTVLEVINQVTQKETKPNPATPTEADIESAAGGATEKKEEEALVQKVLELESHLIETVDESSLADDGVGIKELAPVQDELSEGTSKLDTESNVHTVIEVEPAGAKTKQPIATVVQGAEPKAVVDDSVEPAPQTETPIKGLEQTAARLLSEIERDALQTLQEHYQQSTSTPASPKTETESTKTLSEKVDEQISEVTSILKGNRTPVEAAAANIAESSDGLKVVDVPESSTVAEAEERKQFIDSLPQIDTEAKQLSADCKREYYQSLKKYLIQSGSDKPPVPLQTYRWEDLRRAKERGGYPWTHLYKRPLGPDEEPEIILLLRKSQELRFTSESPKSLKKVRIDEQILIKETERYIQDLSDDEKENLAQSEPVDSPTVEEASKEEDEETHSLHSESISCVSDSVLATQPRKPRSTKNSLSRIRRFLKRRRSGRSTEDAQSLPGTSTQASRRQSEENVHQTQGKSLSGTKSDDPKEVSTAQKPSNRVPIMKKLKSMADRQKMRIKRIKLRKDEKIVLGEETKILRLKNSPKSNRGEIAHFIEKQDSDDILEIVELEESPSRKRKDDEEQVEETPQLSQQNSSHVEPDEIIEVTKPADEQPPKKAPRLRREHVYEEIGEGEAEAPPHLPEPELFDATSVEALKESLSKQDTALVKDIEMDEANRTITLDRMGSSEEEPDKDKDKDKDKDTEKGQHLLAPISSIESTSSDEDRNRPPPLTPVAEESDAASVEGGAELKPSIKKEASPAPSDKKVTFSHVEDEAESHREDIELPAEVQEAAAANKNKWKHMSDHEYEPIAVPTTEEAAPQLEKQPTAAETVQRDIEDRYFNQVSSLPTIEPRADTETQDNQAEVDIQNELSSKPENRKRGFMASAQDRTRRMQAGIRQQAGKIRTKFRVPVKRKKAHEPKEDNMDMEVTEEQVPQPEEKTDVPQQEELEREPLKERKLFKAPEFAKMKLPELKRPDISKLRDFKRPEFTKFQKPDMSKFKIPEKLSTLKLRRSKSFKENETVDETTPENAAPPETAPVQPTKRMFDFNFGTYPRAFRRKKKQTEPEESFDAGTTAATTDTATGPSVVTSSGTQPSLESSSSPQGDRGPGPVRSRWADKFSDVSYNDSEGSRYRRYGSEQESFDRESSLERRMREDLEDTGSEAPDMGILGVSISGIAGVAESKQFADFDEENRAIHEISNLRAGEFKRRPMVHQDSDLRSEDSKEVGWTDKEILKNKLLRQAELEAELSFMRYDPHDAQSTASSGKKVVMEEIDDDEFFLRKRGISEDNIELRNYISEVIREGYDTPINTLERVGRIGEPINYADYDVPPPKPRRLHRAYPADDNSFDAQRSDYGDNLSMSQNGSDFFVAPKRPLRKGRSRSKYSMDSHDEGSGRERYFDDDEEYLRPPRMTEKNGHADEIVGEGEGKVLGDGEVDGVAMNDLDMGEKVLPKPPRRRKRHLRGLSLEKDSYMNGFSGRSVSNSYLEPPNDVIVYRTEHEYHIPLATPENYTDGTSHKSRSTSRFDEDDRTSRGADSSLLDGQLKRETATTAADADHDSEKFVIDLLENDGYAVVRKEQLPKPTPPARRKKFSRSPGERFATLPNIRSGKQRNSPPPARPPPPRDYVPSTPPSRVEPMPPRRKSTQSLDTSSQNFEDDYEEPGRPESPRNLQSGEVINKMKFRPLPPPPRPPREKRLRGPFDDDPNNNTINSKQLETDTDAEGERMATSSSVLSESTLDDVDARLAEIEVSTQTDPLPYDFVCEEFEITNDMRVIEPRRPPKTLDELMREEQARIEANGEASPEPLPTEDEQLARGLQRFRDANQRSLSEKSRASSQADRSRSLSRPQTPSAVVIERRVSTPAPMHTEPLIEASLIVRPINDHDLELEEAALRREGLLSDESQQSKSDIEAEANIDEELESKPGYSDISSPEAKDTEDEQERDRALLASKEEDYEYDEEEIERYLRQFAEREAAEQAEAAQRQTSTEEATLPDQPDEQAVPEAFLQATTFKETLAPTESSSREFESTMEVSMDNKVEKEEEQEEEVTEPINPPLPPPRRKSAPLVEAPQSLVVAESVTATSKEVAPVDSVVPQQPALQQSQLPTHLGDLEVERLRVHALQAGQIMVSQLHGTQISSDELECKSGNLVVRNIELPPGFIEDIVERVRNTDRSQQLTTETQTSLQASSEGLNDEVVPPPKPPRQRDQQQQPSAATVAPVDKLRNLDEETQTEMTQPMPAMIYPTPEYLQSLGPLAFYNLTRTDAQPELHDEQQDRSSMHRRHQRRRVPSSSELDENDPDADYDGRVEADSRPRRYRTRSGTRSPTVASQEPQTVAHAGKQFITACSLSIAAVINQLTGYLRNSLDKDQGPEGTTARQRHVNAFVIIFLAVTLALLVYLLSGKQIHTHHWDFFNLPGNAGRQS